MKLKLGKKGFTLMELIIVIAIIAILMMIAIPAMGKYIDESRKVVAETNANSLINQVNSRLAINADAHTEGKDLLKYLKSNAVISYLGPKDNSIIKSPINNDHDHAKNSIRNLLGGTIVQFGYRAHFEMGEHGSYYIKKLEVFYKTPARAAELATPPDFVLP